MRRASAFAGRLPSLVCPPLRNSTRARPPADRLRGVASEGGLKRVPSEKWLAQPLRASQSQRVDPSDALSEARSAWLGWIFPVRRRQISNVKFLFQISYFQRNFQQSQKVYQALDWIRYNTSECQKQTRNNDQKQRPGIVGPSRCAGPANVVPSTHGMTEVVGRPEGSGTA